MNNTPQSYSFDNSWEEAERRLQLLEQLHDPMTQACLHPILSYANTRRVWEIGGGGGSVARYMAEYLMRTREQSEVVVSDLNTTVLERVLADTPNISLMQHDVTLSPPEGAFDLIHCRAVLCHIPTRQQLLCTIAEKLHAGGCALLEEPYFESLTPCSQSSEKNALFSEMVDAITRYQDCYGTMSHHFGPALLKAGYTAGLRPVSVRREFQVLTGGSGGAEFFYLTYKQIEAPLTEKLEVSRSQFQSFLRLFKDPDFSFNTYEIFSVCFSSRCKKN